MDILTYWDLNTSLTSSQATALYNGNPRVLGSELTKNSDNAVVFNGKDFDLTAPDVVDQLRAAKQAKIDGANNAAKLVSAKTTAENTIKAEKKATGKIEVTDDELNKHLK